MKIKNKQYFIRYAFIVLPVFAFLMVTLYLCLFLKAETTYATTESVKRNVSTIQSDYYYDNDNGKYATSNSIKHNEWSHFFNLALGSDGNYTQSGLTFTISEGYPMSLYISGTSNYYAISNNGKNDGNDGMHHYSYDSNGYINDWLVGSGRIVFEYYTGETTVYKVLSEGLWERDLSVPIEIPLKYHTGIKIRVKLCYELWKYENGKTRFWNITQWSETFYLKTGSLPYNKTVKAIQSDYPKFDGDKDKIKKAVEKPLYIKGVNRSTSNNSSIRLELQNEYLATPVNANFYANSTSDSWGLGGFDKQTISWWYSLRKGSYIVIDGQKSDLACNSEGIFALTLDSISSQSIEVNLHINLRYHYSKDRWNWWGANYWNANSYEKDFSIEYKSVVPLSVSNINDGAVLFYDDIASNNYSNISLVMDEMVRSKNTLGIVSTSRINQFSIEVEKFENDGWRVATKNEYTDNLVPGTANHRIVFKTSAPIEKFRVSLKDNDSNTNSRSFYIVSDLDKALNLKLSNEQYNALNNLPWVKAIEDHQVTCIFSELLHFDSVNGLDQTKLENDSNKIIKKVILGSKVDGRFVGEYHEFTYEFYIGKVAAPRFNSLKLSATHYHILPQSYSVNENGYVYAFKELEEARAFVAKIIKNNYKKPSSLSAAISDKKLFDNEIESRIQFNESQWELIAKAQGDINKIKVATNTQAPIGEKIYIYNDDFFALSKTDTISISLKSSQGKFISGYLSGNKLSGKEIAKLCGYDSAISVTEQFYDGTSLTYEIIVLNGIRPIAIQ